MKKSLSFLFLALSSAAFAETDGVETVRQSNSLWQTLIMIAIAIVFFYFILWRPEQKRRKQMEAQRSAMKKGDTVTAMGIVGTIDRIKDQTIIIKNVDGSKIEVLKGAISDVKSEAAAAKPEEEKVEDKSS